MAAKSVVTIGIFDGLHEGHQAVIKKAVQIGRRKHLTSIAITFDRHPLSVLKPAQHICLLTTPAEKISRIRKLGIDQIMLIEFDEDFAHLSPKDFFDQVLLPLNVQHIVVGEEFRFGQGRSGDVRFLENYGRKHGVCLTIQPLLQIGREKISSSRIRSLLKEGKVKEVAEMLGRFPIYRGRVVPGEARGKRIGFPSANIELNKNLCMPKIGVYAGYLKIDGQRKKSLLSWGYAPTFGKRKEPILEAHCLDSCQDLYSKEVEVELKWRLRREISFPNEEALAKQLKKDAKKAQDMLR